ncbi:MAG: AAA family ATPase [Bacteroidales bacterium]|nr:AAA family ATPase [Bacteroidales bacterium]
MQLIGREQERKELEKCLNSQRSEFVVIYGRRRIGKTFLIRKFFDDKFDFSFVGMHNYARQAQLDDFAKALKKYSGNKYALNLKNWDEAFEQLELLLEKKKKIGKKVVFIDEMPWIDSRRSDFIPALEKFWNSWAAFRDDIMFVCCGSSTSWIIDKILKNRGGLYNRTTMQIYLRPFTLGETKLYLENIKCNWDDFQIAQCYMILGGVPYYYSLLESKESLVENVDRLFFSSKNAVLRTEFSELFAALFPNYEKYADIIKLLSTRQEGFTRTQISEKQGFGGSELTKILDNLERCDFITGYVKTGGGNKNKIYRICDFYTLFYYRFIEKNAEAKPGYWQKVFNSTKIAVWQGYSFELLCLLHISQIEKALGISGMVTTASTWRSKNNEAQIDLVIERADRIIHLCEMKFSKNNFVLTKDYEKKLRDRAAIFEAETGTKFAVNTVFITTYGVANAQNYSIISKDITLEMLF